MGLVLKCRTYNATEWLALMAKRKSHPQEKVRYNGYVYILKIWIDADIIVKIGTTNRTPLTRMMEICGEMYRVLGYVPKMTLLREQQTKNNYKVEAELLELTKEHRYNLQCERDMCGESELRKMDEHMMCMLFDKCINKDYPATEMFKVML